MNNAFRLYEVNVISFFTLLLFGYKASYGGAVLCLPPIIPEFPWRPRAVLATVWLGASSSYWHYRVNSECDRGDRRGVVTATNCFNCSSSPSRQYYSGKSPVSSVRGPDQWDERLRTFCENTSIYTHCTVQGVSVHPSDRANKIKWILRSNCNPHNIRPQSNQDINFRLRQLPQSTPPPFFK